MMLRTRPHGPFSIGRDLDVFASFFIASHITKQTRIAIFNVGGPHLLLRFFELARGIRHMSGAADFAAAGINYGASLGSEPKTGDGHSVVALIMRHLVRLKIGSVGDPDVAFTLVIEDPCDARALHRPGETRRKWRAHNLLNCEA